MIDYTTILELFIEKCAWPDQELDIPQKMARLKQWCADATAASKDQDGTAYGFVYVDEEGFEKHPPKTFAGLVAAFREYQGD